MDNLILAKFENVEKKVNDLSNKQDNTSSFTYSNDETWTGKYWIDGKKIYCKSCIGITGVTVNTGYIISNMIIPITGTVVNIIGTILRTEGSYFTNWNGVSFYVTKTNGNVNYWVSATNCVNVPFSLIIEYTK